jgi:hypothetical protein
MTSFEQRQLGDRQALGVHRPLLRAAHKEAERVAGSESALELLAAPAEDCVRDGLGGAVTSEDLQRSLPMPRIVGVQAQPAIRCPPEPRKGSEQVRRSRSLRTGEPLAARRQRDMHSIDQNGEGARPRRVASSTEAARVDAATAASIAGRAASVDESSPA